MAVVTAFETIYFWPSFVEDLKEIFRVMKPGGRILLGNEVTKEDDGSMTALTTKSTEMMDLKNYTGHELCAALTEAGFENAEFLRAENASKSSPCIEVTWNFRRLAHITVSEAQWHRGQWLTATSEICASPMLLFRFAHERHIDQRGRYSRGFKRRLEKGR
jgi:hypothetical protein